ncbi:polysaccharide biosynthesis protein [Gammaproteobacteria bacterium]|nr:polysaccharide biosynthesis protein [Gammaproteobacteria bacterium]
MSKVSIFLWRSNHSRTLLHILMDGIIICSSFILSLIISNPNSFFSSDLFILMGISLFVALASLILLGFYKNIISHITGKVAIPAFIAISLSVLATCLSIQYLKTDIDLANIIFFGLISFAGILGARFFYRHIKMLNMSKIGTKRVLIYGAGSAGRQLANGLGLTVEFLPIIFIDDDIDLEGKIIGGLKVFDASDIELLIRKFYIDVVVLAMPSITIEQRRYIVSKFDGLPLTVNIMPGFGELMSGVSNVSNIRKLSINDVLGRDQVLPKHELLDKTIKDQVVAVTGAGGSIGSELCRKIISSNPKSLILIDNSEYALYKINEDLKVIISNTNLDINLVPILGSVQDYAKMKLVIAKFSVDTLFHSAAYKHVPLVETNIAEGVKNNVFGTLAVAQAAADCGVKIFTLVSTDKAVRPTNIMGASKRMAEFICTYIMDRAESSIVFSMVRFGNVIGSSGSVVPLFERQIKDGGPITITHKDITRFFMTIPEAAELVIQAAALAKGREVFLLNMGESIKILDLAETMIKLENKIPFFPKNHSTPTPSGHIPILFTGLRPGEKLYEELLVNEESSETEHPLIMYAIEYGPSSHDLQLILDKLRIACDNAEEYKIRSLLIEAGTGLTTNKNENIKETS